MKQEKRLAIIKASIQKSTKESIQRGSFYHQYKGHLARDDEKANEVFGLLPTSFRQEKAINDARAKSTSIYLNLLGANTSVKSWVD